MRTEASTTRRRGAPVGAWRFVLVFGVISLLADFVYEGGRSIIGPFLGSLGASGTTVGVVAGAGEATALVFRLVAGPLADRTRRFWAFTIAGYALTIVSVPLLAATGHLGVAVGLFLAERFGKAVRTPARDTMLAGAGADIGRGWAFAVHEALDQFGAVLGPLVVAVAVARGNDFAPGFAVLAVPGVLCLALLLWLRRAVPDPLGVRRGAAPAAERHPPPADAPPADTPRPASTALGAAYWRYLAFTALAVTGLAPFALASYHAVARGLLTAGQVPLLYAVAMATDAVVALVAGRAYDRRGLVVLGVLPLLAAAVPALSFARTEPLVWFGAAAWGAAMGLHESVLRAAVADLTTGTRTATAYGVFTALYGAASLAGDTVIGVLYDRSIAAVVAVVVVIEAAALLALPVAARAASAGAQRPGRLTHPSPTS